MKNEYLKSEKEYINKANLDIKNDRVTYKYAGGLTISECNQNTENKIDSINKRYGLIFVNTGCVVMEREINAQEKYAEIVKPYLGKKKWKKLETENGKRN